jgi:hypothetical protein
MKTQLTKPARSKARYTDQYKQEALELRSKRGQIQVLTHISTGCIPWHDGQTIAHRVSRGNLSCA